ncbi:hypothetical protein OsJ_28726 [Oryza sativa Japonica Group]|uniref:Uncharacterized protein n=1 Tax=Oryza sativa subsp. japonica TaxID=39947 RepID=A3BX12_ORYSJ|nr:hypothetical protein OsJ_28726 [Oryza sativa Japonica Group]
MRGASGDRVCALSLSGLAVARDALGMDDDALVVALKAPGVWRVDPVLAAVGDRVVAMGGACRLALGDGEDTSAVEVDGDSLSLSHGAAAAHDTMPSEMSERLFPHGDDGEEETSSPSIGVCGNTAGGYVYNAAVPATGAVLYELRRGGVEGGGVERWAWVACAPVVAEAEALGRVILACSPVGLHELADERLAH